MPPICALTRKQTGMHGTVARARQIIYYAEVLGEFLKTALGALLLCL